MNEPLGIALELMAKRKALAARLSPFARKLAFPDHYDFSIKRRTIVKPKIMVVGTDWSTDKRVTKYDKADAAQANANVIVEVCASTWGVPAGQIYDVPRKAIYVRPRQAAMNLMREMLGLSQPVIGVVLNRDHTSVLHGLRKHAETYEANRDYARRYDQAQQQLGELFKPNAATTSDTVTAAGGEEDGRTERPSLPSSASQEAA